MQLVGLTGGIATGKSTVSHFIATLGINIIDADIVAREIVNPGTCAYYLIIKHFGDKILKADSTLDRQALGNIIFANARERQVLNTITHPRIRVLILLKILKSFILGHRIIILDTPLLFETGLYRWVHSTVVVYCKPELQFERLINRDHCSVDLAKSKISSQMPIDEKKNLADFVIENSASLSETRSQAKSIITYLTPGTFSVFVMWSLLLWPAIWLYIILSLYKIVDHLKHTRNFATMSKC